MGVTTLNRIIGFIHLSKWKLVINAEAVNRSHTSEDKSHLTWIISLSWLGVPSKCGWGKVDRKVWKSYQNHGSMNLCFICNDSYWVCDCFEKKSFIAVCYNPFKLSLRIVRSHVKIMMQDSSLRWEMNNHPIRRPLFLLCSLNKRQSNISLIDQSL